MKIRTQLVIWGVLTVPTILGGCATSNEYVYIQSNDPRPLKNAVIGFKRAEDGSLTKLRSAPFYTNGTGINNDTNGKLGPNDNDTPLIISEDKKLLFTVNAHSNSIAVFRIEADGSLEHVEGSPFPSRGIAPNSLSLSGDVLLVSNRNEDYHQKAELMGKETASYVSFKVSPNGHLTFVSKIPVNGAQKPTQVHVANSDARIAFGNDFQVDADFDGDGTDSVLAGPAASVQGQLHSFFVSPEGSLEERQLVKIPETNASYKYLGTPNVVSMPLGIWSHPTTNLLYVGFVTRNELGVFEFDRDGRLRFISSVPNSGQDICWILANSDGSRLYTVNNLPRAELGDRSSTVTTYDISGVHAKRPIEISRLELPNPGKTFINNRTISQPESTAFQMALSKDESSLFVISQRINQRIDDPSLEGNYLHVLSVDGNGVPHVAYSRDLRGDGILATSRPQGVAAIAF